VSTEADHRREHWQQVESLYREAMDHRGEARTDVIDRGCAGDASLREEVESLLACEAAAADFIETPALAVAADLLANQTSELRGRQVGPYVIQALLGSGGMGDVYRARDTRLHRDVALKVLHPDVDDRDRLARFRREAEMLAALNHPNVAAIYGVEDVDGAQALVLELVDGPTLADRLEQGPIPIDDTVSIARQIAAALEAAHDRGLVHRDLKPANIKVRDDGTVKVLDFGLAKLAHASEPTRHDPAPLTHAPTITGAGLIMGTAAYMSPEQAKGQDADRRSDVWAFGAVLYEMLTGRRAFDGETMADVLGAVMRLEPQWDAVPAAVPAPLRLLLEKCLVKDRRKRIADISTVRFLLDNADTLAAAGSSALVASPDRRGRRPALVLATAVLTAALAGVGMAMWFAAGAADPVARRVSRFQIGTPEPADVTVTGTDLAISPDGSTVVYVGNGGTQLFVRALDALEPVAVFTGAPDVPFMSPDGQWIGFFDTATVLKRVKTTGGPASTIATLDSRSRGATWTSTDTIVTAPNSVATGLIAVTVGGPARVLTRPDPAKGEADHRWPEALPGGRAVLFTITALSGGLDAAQVAVLDLETGERTTLFRGGSHARYVSGAAGSSTLTASTPGHLVYVQGGALWAVPFDPSTLQTRGTPAPVVSGVVTDSFGAADAVVARNGTLAYLSGQTVTARTGPNTLVWVDRQGSETSIPAPPRAYVLPRLSPDGTRVAVFSADQEFDIWSWDLSSAATGLTRRTFNPTGDSHPVWTRDGSRLIFASEQQGVRNLFWQAADGAGPIERLAPSATRQRPTDVAPDGRVIISDISLTATRDDILAMTLDSSRRVTPLVQSASRERNGVVSPDGRWLAYEADDSGRFEIWVRPYPDVSTAKWQVTTTGGTRPLWTRDGQELIYVLPSGALMGMKVSRGPSWAATPPAQIVKSGYFTNPIDPAHTYDVSPDGRRFLLIKRVGGPQSAAPASLVVVLNWTEELKRLVPAN
jgi:eukaryotic-like serine/threonine-protein kinase